MKLSMHSICIERKYPLLEAIPRAAALGYQGYEIDIGDFGNTGLGLHWPEEFTAERVGAADEAARLAGSEIGSLCLGVLWKYYPTASDETTRAQAVEIIKQAAPLTALAGAKVILLPVGQPEDCSAEEARERLIDVLKECAPEAEKAGVVYAVENVGQPLAHNVEHLLEIVARVDSPACQVYYDVGNATSQGADPVADIRRLGSQLAMVHVKDFQPGEPRGKTVIIGDGIVDWEAVVGALSEVNYDGFLTLEVPGTAETADEIAERSRDALLQFMS